MIDSQKAVASSYLISEIVLLAIMLLNKLDLVLLKNRRFRSKSIMMYNILNNLIDIPSCYFISNEHSKEDILPNYL